MGYVNKLCFCISADALAITNAILKQKFLNKLDTEKIIAQSYDGANVISGANEGI